MSPQATAPPQSSAQRQFKRAVELERQRASLQREVASNRNYLRLMAENKELDDETFTVGGSEMDALDWLEDFYPEKEKNQRRSAEEVERTRRVKEAARKDGNA